MKPIDVKEIRNFELVQVDNLPPCLFTDLRIDKDSLPSGIYAYDVRDCDCDGTFAEIKKFVLVNHWGTILCKEEVPLDEYGSYYPEEGENYIGYSTLEEFCKSN